MLLKADPPANANARVAYDHGYALEYAVSNGNADIVKLLIDACAAAEQPLEDVDYILWTAADSGNVRVVQLLLDWPANANSYNGHSLSHAARRGHVDVVRMLLHAEMPAFANANRSYALFEAAKCGHSGVVRLLLDADPPADINCVTDAHDGDGWHDMMVIRR